MMYYILMLLLNLRVFLTEGHTSADQTPMTAKELKSSLNRRGYVIMNVYGQTSTLASATVSNLKPDEKLMFWVSTYGNDYILPSHEVIRATNYIGINEPNRSGAFSHPKVNYGRVSYLEFHSANEPSDQSINEDIYREAKKVNTCIFNKYIGTK